jgi:hypothetical protein
MSAEAPLIVLVILIVISPILKTYGPVAGPEYAGLQSFGLRVCIVGADLANWPQSPSASTSGVWQVGLLLRFSQTSRILMSAGETPDTREACPTVPGRIFDSF